MKKFSPVVLVLFLLLSAFMVEEVVSIGFRLLSPHGRNQQRHQSGNYPSAYYRAGRDQFEQDSVASKQDFIE
ncbi:hypothetical protein GHT06_013949 [Daphnia sinensis]|uniref:Uncharacterized protein n=1 Tax=Daphnia sinensis TaxID=1820382 RepID=A0AAD5KVN8_9CRUS|nr:hypothetical protein GHT06_013949 [Daphnia sinensis]